MILLAQGDVNIYWYLPPAVVAISLVYSGTRFETWPFILGYALRWSVYILTFLGAAWIFMALLGTGSMWAVPIALGGLFFFLFPVKISWPFRKKAESAPPQTEKTK